MSVVAPFERLDDREQLLGQTRSGKHWWPHVGSYHRHYLICTIALPHH